jgi:hypothetical protein
VTVTSAALTDTDHFMKIDQLSAELANCVYQLALRETKPQSWLDLELRLWKAINNRLKGRCSESC